MSLSFLNTESVQGTSCYIIYGSHPNDLPAAVELQKAIDAEFPDHAIIFDHNSNEGRSILEFYAIHDTRFPIFLMVRDDDSLAYEWSTTLPDVNDVLYRLRQIGQ